MADNEEYIGSCSSGLLEEPNANGPLSTSIYSSQVFSFLVGEKTFYAHKALISKHSKPLDRLMNADMKEKEQMTATLADIEPATFARFLEWAYKGYYTPAPHTMDQLPAALSEGNGIKKEQKEFAGMFSTEPLFTYTQHEEGDRLTPRAASLLQPEAPTQGRPPAPFPRPAPQPAAAAPTAAPLAPAATVPAGGLFGATAAPSGNTAINGSTTVRPASANSAPNTASGLFSGFGATATPSTTRTPSSSTPNPASNNSGLFLSVTAPTPTSTPSTSSSTVATATTSRSSFLDATRPASANASTAGTATTVGGFGAFRSTRSASTGSTSNIDGSDGASTAPGQAPTSSTSAVGSTTTPASASSAPSTNPITAGAGTFGSATGLFGSRPIPTSSASAFESTTTPTTSSSTPNTNTGTGFGSAAGLFGSRPAPTSSASPFGSTTAPFGSTTTPFGSTITPAPATTTSTGSLFDRPSSGSGFGSTSLGAANPGTGLFGSNTASSSNPSGSSLFGNAAPSSNTSISANPAPSGSTNTPSIFASRATPAFGGFGAPPTAPPSLTQPTGLFGRTPSPSGAATTAERQRSPSPFGGTESNPGLGTTSSTQRNPFVSAKDQLKEAFISRQPKVLRTVIEIPPTRGNWFRENHTDVLLSHAQLYVFADEQDIQPLKTLALESLHAALSLFSLYPARTKDIVSLFRYSYDNTADGEGYRDELRELLTDYMGLEMEILVKDMGLRDLMTKDDDGIGQEERAALLGDFMAVVAKRL